MLLYCEDAVALVDPLKLSEVTNSALLKRFGFKKTDWSAGFWLKHYMKTFETAIEVHS